MKASAVYHHLLLLVTFLFPVGAGAHEFWIEPLRFVISSDDRIAANLNVGKYFKGNVQSFIPARFVEFSVTDSSGKRTVSGRLGDLPALDEPLLHPGLQILSYRSRPQSAVYEDFSKFERFAQKEGNLWIIDEHKNRGLSRRNVTEAYTRFAKSLVQSGDVSGEDSVLGFPLEIVVESNPYADLTGDDIPVVLLWQGKGLSTAQISVFQKSGGCEASLATVLTDERGRAAIPRGSGGRFLLNAVHVTVPTAETLRDINADWESLWASTTFELPVAADPGGKSTECQPLTDVEEK
jgi:uncharacterized GH25 family protein